MMRRPGAFPQDGPARAAPVTPALRRYIAIEAAIGAMINAVLSLAFFWLIFGNHAQIPVFGMHGLILDAVPQSVMIAAMSTIVPTLITRRRIRAGAVQSSGEIGTMPIGRRTRRAVLLAAGGAILGIVLTSALLAAGPAHWPAGIVAIGKVIYGALLGGIMSALATRAALTA